MAGKVTIGARFKPMSYAEMIAPVQGANQEFRAQQDELDKLNQASSVWENMANKETDPLAYQKYTNFSNTLKQQADILATQGLTPNSRKVISQMKGQYQAEILPIEQAYKRRDEMSKNYEKARMQNPTLMSNVDPSKLSLDKLIANPSLAPEFYSGNLLAEQVSAKARVLANQLRETGQWKSTAGGQMLERIEKYGLSPKDVAMVQAGQGPKELQDLVNSTIASSPIGKWENAKDLLPQAYQYAASGLYSGIGKEDIKTGQDQSYLTPMQRHQINKDNEAAALAKAKATAENNDRPLTWEPLGNAADAKNSPKVKQYNKDIEFLKMLQTGDNFTKLLNPKREVTATGVFTDAYMASKGNYHQSSLKNQNLQKWNELTKKYGTKNPTQLIQKINQDIAKTTSTYRETALKTLNNTNLNTLLLGQLSVNQKDKEELIKTSKGKKLKPEEIAKVFNEDGRLVYSPETKQLGMMNPKHEKDTRFILDRNVISNIRVPLGVDAKGEKQDVSSLDYLDYIDRIYEKDPTNPNLNTLIGRFYDAVDVYSKTFNQSAPTSNSKEIINAF